MEKNIIIDEIVKVLQENSSHMEIEKHNTKSTLTFVGSVDYYEVAGKIADAIQKLDNDKSHKWSH